MSRNVKGITSAAMAAYGCLSLAGKMFRELENLLERMVVLTSDHQFH